MTQIEVMVYGNICRINAEIEAMKVANLTRPDDPRYKEQDFWDKANEISNAVNELFK